MERFAICEKRTNMKFYAARQFVEAPDLKAFLQLPETIRTIQTIERYKDCWRIVRWVEDPNATHELVHKGNS